MLGVEEEKGRRFRKQSGFQITDDLRRMSSNRAQLYGGSTVFSLQCEVATTVRFGSANVSSDSARCDTKRVKCYPMLKNFSGRFSWNRETSPRFELTQQEDLPDLDQACAVCKLRNNSLHP